VPAKALSIYLSIPIVDSDLDQYLTLGNQNTPTKPADMSREAETVATAIPLVTNSERTPSTTLQHDGAARYCRIVHPFPLDAFCQKQALESPDETH
jgi:hypothetical protein